MVARQKIHAGMIHAGKTATVICENTHFRVVIDGETAAVVPRTTTSEVHRRKSQRHPPAVPGRLGALLAQFVGHPAYGITQLREDLERFTFLLGGSDGEQLFGP